MSEYKNVEDPFIQAANRQVAKNAPVEEPEVVEEVVEETIVPETVEPTETPISEEVDTTTVPTEEDEVTPAAEPTEEEAEDVDIFENWDELSSEEEDAPTTDPQRLDISSITDSLKDVFGEDKIDSAQALVQKVRELHQEKSRAADSLAGIPENLKKAIEIAQLDGDYLQYLGVTSVDYNSVDDTTLVQDKYARLLTDANGNVDVEKLAEIMEGMSDTQIELQGKELRNQYIANQRQFETQVAKEAQAAKLEADRELRKALEGLNEVRGFKLNATHKKNLYESISSGKIVQDLFYGDDGKMDYAKIAKIVFDYQNGDKINKVLTQRIKTSAKKEMIDKLSNKNVDTSRSEPARPDTAPKTAQAAAAEWLRGGGKI